MLEMAHKPTTYFTGHSGSISGIGRLCKAIKQMLSKPFHRRHAEVGVFAEELQVNSFAGVFADFSSRL